MDAVGRINALAERATAPVREARRAHWAYQQRHGFEWFGQASGALAGRLGDRIRGGCVPGAQYGQFHPDDRDWCNEMEKS